MIEFTKDSERATVTFCQGRYKSRIKKLAADRPEECQIVAENTDGSLCAHIPVAWIKINPTYQLTEEERAESGNHAPELLEMTVIIGLKMGKSGLKWCEGRNIRVRG